MRSCAMNQAAAAWAPLYNRKHAGLARQVQGVCVCEREGVRECVCVSEKERGKSERVYETVRRES